MTYKPRKSQLEVSSVGTVFFKGPAPALVNLLSVHTKVEKRVLGAAVGALLTEGGGRWAITTYSKVIPGS